MYYWDRLRVHLSNSVKDFLEAKDIEAILAPSYSPALNSIEYLFSVMKREVKKHRLSDMVK